VSLYDDLKAKGQRLGWYERSKARRGAHRVIPLNDDRCSNLSVYLLKADGSLWTLAIVGRVNAQGIREDSAEPYKQVRPPGKAVGKDVYVCVCCKAQAGEYQQLEHLKEVM
jgi:hypothetical protein